MKKLILFLGIALLLGQKGISQCPNTDTHWCLSGNNSPGLGIFGTANAGDILLETYGIQTGWMDETNQYTGIGTGWNAGNRPNFQLDVLHLSSTNGNIFRTIGNGLNDCNWEAWTETGTGGPDNTVKIV